MKYHKIDSIFKRDTAGKIIEGEYSRPEFAYLADNQWEFTEKVDGTNIRLTYPGYAIPGNEHTRIAGRTDNAQIPPPLLARLIDIMRAAPLGEVFGTDPTSVVMYGEGFGAKIQKGGGNYIPDGCDFVLFDVNIGGIWLQRGDVEDIATKLGITAVPRWGTGTLRDAIAMARVGFASERWPGVLDAEGLVLRPSVELAGRGGNRIITKIKAADFR